MPSGTVGSVTVDEDGADHVTAPEHEVLGVGGRHEHQRLAGEQRRVPRRADHGERGTADGHGLADIDTERLVERDLTRGFGGTAVDRVRRAECARVVADEDHLFGAARP